MADVSREYDGTIKYLYGLQKHGIKLGLSNISAMMNRLGEPHRAFRSVHIAGTNGKGSTAAALSAVLIECGFSVGLFTSPHLVSFTERIGINNVPITEDEVIELASRVRSSISHSELNPTFFEVVTAMAFSCFAENNVDWAVVETGMGGRLDATNIITPEITIITNISYDHSEFLGDSIAEIAFEKAGIIKQDVPVITGSQNTEALKQIRKIARSRNAPLHVYGDEFRGELRAMDQNGITLNYEGERKYGELRATLTGKYQLLNISLAVRACEILMRKGTPVSEEAIRKGLQHINLEGRLEVVSQDPPIIIDGAHNPDAAASLADSVEAIFGDKKVVLVAGIMGDKNITGILEPLMVIAEKIILTKAKYERAASPERIQATLREKGIPGKGTGDIPLSIVGDVKEALDLAVSLCGKDHIILVTGSFYTTGEVKEILGRSSVLTRLREYK